MRIPWFLSCLPFVAPLCALEPLREMSTDRPDTTESPYTVPRGMIQVEASVADYSRDAVAGDGVSDQWTFGQINLKLGMSHASDLQLVVNSHAVAGESERGDRSRTSGFGDVTLRYKHNLWGNDAGTTAFAVMPYVTIPTHTGLSGEAWQGGLILPLAISFSERLSLGVMAEVDLVHDVETGGTDLEWLHSASLGVALTERLGMFFELVGIAGDDTAYAASCNAGITRALSDNLVLDAGVRIGMNRAAADFGIFSGISFRF